MRRAGRVRTIVAAGASVGAVLAPAASAGQVDRAAVRAGDVYGGVTSQGFAIEVELNKSRTQVVRAAAGIRMKCVQPGNVYFPDSFAKLTYSRRGRFSNTYGPEIIRNSDGTTSDFSGSVSGAANAARTKLSGTWTAKVVYHDTTGAVADTCDSGKVTWTARQ